MGSSLLLLCWEGAGGAGGAGCRKFQMAARIRTPAGKIRVATITMLHAPGGFSGIQTWGKVRDTLAGATTTLTVFRFP